MNGPHVSVFLGLSCLEIVYYLECQNLSDLHLGFLSPSVTFKLMLYRKKCEGKVCLSLFFLGFALRNRTIYHVFVMKCEFFLVEVYKMNYV